MTRENLRRPIGRAVMRLAFLALALGGCKAAPSHFEARMTAAKAEEVKAVESAEAAEAVVGELERRERELEREGQSIRAKQNRMIELQNAAIHLSSGDRAKSLEIVERLLGDEGTKVLVEADPRFDGEEDLVVPAMEPVEKSQALAIKGAVLFARGERDASIEVFRESAELDPNNRFARQNLGHTLFAARRYAEALEAWKPELSDGYRSGLLLFRVAQAHYDIGSRLKAEKNERYRNHYEAARLALRDAFVEDPGNEELRRWLAVVEFESERYREGIPLFRAILGDEPFHTEYLTYLGLCHYHLEEWESASEQFELIHRIGKAKRSTYEMLAECEQQLGLPGRAADWYQRAYVAPENVGPESCLQVGYLYTQAKQIVEARRWLTAVPRDASEYFDAQTQLGYLLLDSGEEEAALESLNLARAADPNVGSHHLVVAGIYLDRKELDKAFTAYTRASALGDTAADGYAGLGEVAYERGNLDLAIQLYEKAAKREPEELRFRVILDQLQSEKQIRVTAKEAPK